MASDATDDTPICVRVTPTFAEFHRFNLRMVLRRMRVVVVFAFILLAAFLFMLINSETTTSPATLLPALILPGIVFVYYPAAIWRAARRRWESAAEVREARTYIFTNAGIKVNGTTFDSFTAWSNIRSAEVVGKQLLLSTGQQQFYQIPLYAIGNEEMVNRLKRLVASHIEGFRDDIPEVTKV